MRVLYIIDPGAGRGLVFMETHLARILLSSCEF
jgi:hypothetical protein